jgi:hypothetical protein
MVCSTMLIMFASGSLTIGDRDLGYSSHDIISTMFRVTKSLPSLSEHTKLEFIREIG